MPNDEHVYLLLKNLKQESTKRVEVYYETLLKLANSLQTPTIDNFRDHNVFIQTIVVFLYCYYKNEMGDFAIAQIINIDL